MVKTSRTTVDKAEIKQFSYIADEWWDPLGKFRILHKFNPTRLSYVKEKICQVFKLDPLSVKPLRGLSILDIGCGGGLLCEPLARLGAEMTGADASFSNIKAAKIHANDSGLEINYKTTTAEILAAEDKKFDVILTMEVVEHVADVSLFMEAVTSMIKPEGLMFIATINRTWKAWGLVILGAEYILRWLPKRTHDYRKLLHPGELKRELAVSGLVVIDELGITYNPLDDSWNRSSDMSVNYVLLARRFKYRNSQ